MSDLVKVLGLRVDAAVLLTWLTSLGTIGDHRFRLPTMGLSLFLQVAGIFALKSRFIPASIPLTLEGEHQAR